MKAVLIAMALVRSSNVVVPRPAIFHRAILVASEKDAVDHFEGNMYGVNAKVELSKRTRIAIVHLVGIPIGGRCSGTAWLKKNDIVVLEKSFEKRLNKRLVRVHTANLDNEAHQIIITVKLPMVGIVEMTLE